ncbi:MAG: hypothetical protein K1X35_02680 [Caulobacteraceae bacterium]|nr:hypothetical protein [Caulobacteraceae bacterium]
MSKTPPVPPEQRSFARQAASRRDPRDEKTEAQSGQPGDADVNTREQGRFGNLAQNVRTTHWKTQDR